MVKFRKAETFLGKHTFQYGTEKVTISSRELIIPLQNTFGEGMHMPYLLRSFPGFGENCFMDFPDEDPLIVTCGFDSISIDLTPNIS